MTAVDVAIDRLDAALGEAGLEAFAPPEDLAPLAALDDGIAPYRLPADLRRLWERVDPSTIPVETYPGLDPPDAGLETYRLDRDFFPLYGPACLFPIGAHSGTRWLVELDTDGVAGGTVFLVDGGEAFHVQYRSIADWVHVLAETVADGALERRGGFTLVDERAEAERAAARLAAGPPHPLYGDRRTLPAEVAAWPAHWLVAAGIRLEDREPLGATHTIAELVEEAARGPVRARVAGEVIRLVGIENDLHVVVEDETGCLRVFCPAGVSPWGPSHGRRFELEVTLGRPVATASDIRPID